MSQFGNQGSNPFQNQPGPPRPPQGGSRTVFVQKRPPKKSMSAGMIIGIIVGVLGFCFLCCLGSCCGLWYWDVSSTETEIKNLVKNNAGLRERIGELQTLKTNMNESMDHPDPDTRIYDVHGTEGSGTLIIDWTVDGNNNIVINSLRFRDENGIDQPLDLD